MHATQPFGASQAPLTPMDVQTFASSADRERLSGPAMKAYRALAIRWDLQNSEAAALLGVSISTWERVKKPGRDTALSQDQLTRVSALVGVFKGLHLLFSDGMANAWVRLPNKGPIFDKRTPIDVMIDGGIPVMLDVRRYVDAVRGGI